MATYTYRVYKDDEEKLKVYKSRVTKAEEKLEEVRPQVEQFLKRYRVEALPEQIGPDGHRITTPEGLANIDAMFSSMTAVDVDWTITQEGAGSRERARLTEQALRQEWRKTRVNRKSKRAIKDALIADLGFLKVGYEYAEHSETQPRSGEAIHGDVTQLFQQAAAAGTTPPSPNDVAKLIPLEEEVTVVDRDRIVVDHVPWDHLLVDTVAERWEDVRWVCQVQRMTVDEVKNNSAFKAYCKKFGHSKELQEVKPDSQIKDKAADGDDKLVCVYELWDFDTGMACTFVKSKDFLIDERPNPLAMFPDREDRNPFVRIVVREDPKKTRGIGDSRVMEPALAELDEYRSNQATYVARYIPKTLGPDGGLTAAGKEAMKSRVWGAYVEYDKSASQTDFKPLDPPVLPEVVFGIPQQLEQRVRETTGVSELMRGLFPDRKRTATETQAVVQSTSVRQAEKQDLLTEFYETTARRVITYMQLFYDAPRIARMVEHEGDVAWDWTNDDIVDEYDIEIHLSPKELETQQTRQDRAAQIFNLAIPLAGPDGVFDATAIAMWWAQEMGIPMEVARTFIKTQPEQQQAQADQTQQDLATQAAQSQLDPKVQAALAQSMVRPTTEADLTNSQNVVVNRS